MADHVSAALTKMAEAGAHPVEIAAMRRRLAQLAEAGPGTLDGRTLQPLADVRKLAELPQPDAAQAQRILDQVAVVKLNGGLGTSMGLSGPKSLLEVKPDTTFLDVMTMQVLAVRKAIGARLPLLLMNSPSTREPSLRRLARYPELADRAIPPDFLQGREPKLAAGDLQPVSWPANPELEWCPPGHGDIYQALTASGVLELLLAEGIRWCFVSNSDNLGAVPDVRVATWLAEEDVPFAMEVVRGTPGDRKGGHLAQRDGQILLRESAQVPDGDDSFGDIDRWRYYNTNSIWFDLEQLRRLQADDPSAPALPLIVNRKTVDPADPDSTPVIQLETAMGAAIGAFPQAQVVEIPRSRFVPVKTTDDLLVVRSDAYALDPDWVMVPAFSGAPPVVRLSRAQYGLLPDFEARIPTPPSLRNCTNLQVDGDVTFGDGVVIEGDVRITGPRTVQTGEVLRSGATP